jgi:hypothetical protein
VTGGGGAVFTPASLTNLAAWYDADQQTEGDGNAVSTFTDRSGNGKHFTNTGGTTPTLRHASINGKKTLEWDSIDQLTCAGGLLNGATAGYFFAVIKLNADPPTTGGGAAILDAFGTDLDSYYPFTDGNIYAGFGTNTRKSAGNPTPALTSTALIGVISGASDYRVLVNNASLYSTATNTVAFGTATRTMGYNGSGAFFNGFMAEIIIGNAVPSAGDITNITSYVNTKFGTSF